MNKIIAAATLSILAGCANVGAIKAECDQRYSAPADVAACLAASVKADSRLASDPQGQLFILKVDKLKSMVEAGAMSETDAKIVLQELVIDLQMVQDAKRQAIAEALDRAGQSMQRRQTVTNCSLYGNNATCVSR